MARLTVVIPTFNRPGYLAECLQSVAAQTFRDFDLVVLDNASTEEYGPVLERFSSLGLTYIKNPENIGAYGNHTRALGIAMSSEFALVFHDDDLMHPRLIEWELSALEEDRSLVWAASECFPFIDGAPLPSSVWDGAGGVPTILDNPTALVRLILAGSALNFGSVMYRSATARDVLPDMSTFRSLADRPLLIELAKRDHVALIREPLVLYRHHVGQEPYNSSCTEKNAIALMRYYAALIPSPRTAADQRLLVHHSTNYLLHVFAAIDPKDRGSLAGLVRNAHSLGLFAWSQLDGQGVAALARAIGIEGAYSTVRPALSRLRRALARRF